MDLTISEFGVVELNHNELIEIDGGANGLIRKYLGNVLTSGGATILVGGLIALCV